MSNSQLPSVLDKLSTLEEAVIDAARRGAWVQPDTTLAAKQLTTVADPGLQVRAELIRELLMGRRGELDPRGVLIKGVRVIGQLDLDMVTAVTGLVLVSCALPDGITCQQAHLHRMSLSDSVLPTLFAEGVRINGHFILRAAHITSTNELGALRLAGAHIGGQLQLDSATITNTAGPALVADGIRIDSNLVLHDAHITGTGEEGALRLIGAHIGGQADLTGTQVTNESGPLLAMTEVQVSKAVFFSAALVCPQSRREVGDHLCPDGARRIFAREFVFAQLRGITWREWLHLLVHHTSEYLPQPYQQLAAVERAAGHDNNARTILITQQHDLRRRAPEALGGTFARARHWLWGWLGRYGYRAHRLVTALLVALVLAGATGYIAGQITTRPHHRAAERVQPPTATITAPGTPCSTAELIGLGIDRGLPVGATGLRARCDLDTATRWGQAFTYLLWALQALLWALATLTIAAYTGLIRKIT